MVSASTQCMLLTTFSSCECPCRQLLRYPLKWSWTNQNHRKNMLAGDRRPRGWTSTAECHWQEHELRVHCAPLNAGTEKRQKARFEEFLHPVRLGWIRKTAHFIKGVFYVMFFSLTSRRTPVLLWLSHWDKQVLFPTCFSGIGKTAKRERHRERGEGQAPLGDCHTRNGEV